MELVLTLWRSEIAGHCPRAIVGLQIEGAALESEVTLLAPVLPPRVPHYPVEALRGICSPPDDRDRVVGFVAVSRDDAARVVEEWRGIHGTGNRATVVDLLHHGRLSPHGAVLRDRCIWVPTETN